MKKFLLFASAIAVAVSASAQTFEVDSVKYSVLKDGSGVAVAGASFKAPFNLVVPPIVENGDVAYKVVAIGDQAFMTNEKLLSVKLSKNVAKIGYCSFNNTYNLKSFDFGTGLEYIDELAFGGKYCGVEEFSELPETLNKIVGNPFISCFNIKAFTVSEDNEFYKAVDGVIYTKSGKTLQVYPLGKGLDNVVIPEGVDSIASDMFNTLYEREVTIEDVAGNEVTRTNPGLKSITFPSTLKVIDRNAFTYCKDAVNTNPLPDGVTMIGTNAFSNCSNMALNVPASLEQIYAYTFKQARMAGKVVVPASWKAVTDGAFATCAGIKELIFEEGSQCETFGTAAFQATAPSRIVFPASVKSIGGTAFQSCSNLKYLEFGENLEVIGNNAFGGTYVVIDTIVCHALVPPTAMYANPNQFHNNTYNHALVFVPDDALAAYTAENVATKEVNPTTGRETTVYSNPLWSKFGDRIYPLSQLSSAVKDVISDNVASEITSVKYYNLSGIEVKAPTSKDGKLYIKVNRYANGATKAEKFVNF